MRTPNAIKLAPGTPTAISPIPARSACNSETPMTPCYTFRIVAPASWMISLLRLETRRRKNVATASTSVGPGETRKPAMITEAKNLRIAVATLPAAPSKVPPSGLRCGATFTSAALRLVDARSQNWNNGSPITGQVLTVSTGGGTDNVPDSRRARITRGTSTKSRPSQVTGPRTMKRSKIVISAAANLRRSPSHLATRSKTG
jgi:hypothetical protein